MHEKYDCHQVFDLLTKHVGHIQSITNHILKEFYEERNDERDDFKNMIDQYHAQLKKIMDADQNVFNGEEWPLILIGSIVQVQDLDYDEIEKLKIVPPFYEDRVGKMDCASCLSPVGYGLLFKKIGDKVTVKTPLGSCNFMVKAIDLPVY